ncbi:hypothetical protein BHE74_00002188 [Ensete ventricosum]|nr:hypothetical protein BHE74_00002188 [Ensete ventricosum]
MLIWRTTGSTTPTRSLRSRMLTSRTNTTTLKVITLWRLFVLSLFSFCLPTKECNLRRLTQSFHNLSIKIWLKDVLPKVSVSPSLLVAKFCWPHFAIIMCNSVTARLNILI